MRHRSTDGTERAGTVDLGAATLDAAAGDGAAVRIVAPARLHLGFVDPGGASGRRFGSLGLAIDRPATEIVVRRAPTFAACGLEALRAERAARRLAAALAPGAAFHVDVVSAIPAHAGLGSGTQLALAIGAAILRLGAKTAGPLTPAWADDLGALAERGARSAIGIAAFTGGGFIVDAGKSATRPDRGGRPPPVLMRIPFPEAWRAILVLDARVQGVHGDAEAAAFATLPAFPEAQAAHLAHLVLMQIAPALHEHDLAGFGAALTRIQTIVGAHFAGAQGGTAWSSPAVGALVGRLAAAGAVGVGQSSWGPTGFVFVPDEATATTLYHSFVEEAKAHGLSMMIVRGRNTGADTA
jgi:beta-RFAP synthase